MTTAYRTVLSTPHTKPHLLAVFLSAVPIGMANLALILSVQVWTGSLRWAGVVAACFSVGNALGLLAQGRLLDRRPSRRLIMACGIGCAAALSATALLGPHVVGWPIAGLVFAAGLCVPAIATAVRAWLPTVLPIAGARSAGYALLSMLFQAATMIGPLLVSVCVAWGRPSVALVLAALLMLAATGVYGWVAPAGRARPRPTLAATVTPVPADADTSTRTRWGGLMIVFAVNACCGLSAGVTTVAVPGLLTETGTTALAGAAFSASALGDVCGALVYGLRQWRLPHWARLGGVLVAGSGCAALVRLAAAEPWLVVASMFLVGLAAAPASILQSSLLDDVVPPGRLAGAYSTLVCVSLGALAAGSALAAVAVPVLGTRGLLLVPVPTLLVAGVLAAYKSRRSAPV